MNYFTQIVAYSGPTAAPWMSLKVIWQGNKRYAERPMERDRVVLKDGFYEVYRVAHDLKNSRKPRFVVMLMKIEVENVAKK